MTEQPRVELIRNPAFPNAIKPCYAHPSDAGLDLFAAEECKLFPWNPQLVNTGWILGFLSPGFELQIRPRSGNALKKPLLIPNSPGTIDASYRGQICVIMLLYGDWVIKPGDKIAQMVLARVEQATIVEIDSKDIKPSDRGANGFGSTDKKG